ncbi:hypothetical protein PEX2_001710 [Penicillium expansum]|uniref:Uncharacterized protein n=1 Tax=Penicillium expansum TaxID=27334 RepID=A0A0A2JP60_PENEN|nr:hypothetical protein PEX2_001710 [Penicillium expansum]KGO48688.1 hypothetical protein PEXP_074180 [Penicillium expansum]KGO57197.1 hypothetical protein PEX2_001710 [Penicillium expansum]
MINVRDADNCMIFIFSEILRSVRYSRRRRPVKSSRPSRPLSVSRIFLFSVHSTGLSQQLFSTIFSYSVSSFFSLFMP